MNAWTLLTAHSSLPSGSAWDHLNNQVGGGSGLIINTGATSVVTDSRLAIAIKDVATGIPISNNILANTLIQSISVVIPSGISVIVSTKPITI